MGYEAVWRMDMSGLQSLLEEIRALEKRVSQEVGREAEEYGYTLKRGRARFSDEVGRRHQELKKSVREYVRGASLAVMATGPVIYSLVVPLLFLDLMATLYQWICFPVYGIPRVRRGDHFIYDRHHLKYMNVFERFHCFYCSYANGMLAYGTEIAGRTEQYWCPVKHARRIRHPHSRYYRFFSYGDAERYATELQSLRRQFADVEDRPEKEIKSREKGND